MVEDDILFTNPLAGKGLIEYLLPANQVCKGYVFTPVCQSFCSQGGVGIPACIASGIPACLAAVGVSRSTPSGGKLRDLATGGSPSPDLGGVSRPTPRGGYLFSICTEADPPPRGRLLLRAVRILLECILVIGRFTDLLIFSFYFNFITDVSANIWYSINLVIFLPPKPV